MHRSEAIIPRRQVRHLLCGAGLPRPQMRFCIRTYIAFVCLCPIILQLTCIEPQPWHALRWLNNKGNLVRGLVWKGPLRLVEILMTSWKRKWGKRGVLGREVLYLCACIGDWWWGTTLLVLQPIQVMNTEIGFWSVVSQTQTSWWRACLDVRGCVWILG